MSLTSKGMLSALSSGVALRLVGAAFNLSIVPVAVRSLGPDKYAVFATLLGFASWLSLGSFGMGNVTAMAVAGSKGAKELQQSILWKTSITVFVLLVIVLGIVVWPYARLVSHLGEHLPLVMQSELHVASIYCLLVFSICAWAAPFEGRYTGLLRTHYCNWVRFCSQLLAIVALIIAALYVPTLPALTVAITIAPLGASVWFIMRGVCEVPIPRPLAFGWREASPMLSQGFGFFASSMAVLFLGGASLPLFAFCFGNDQLATAGVITRIVQVYFSFLAILLFPLGVAVRQALAGKDVAWIRNALAQCIVIMIGSAFTVGLILVIWGESLITLWAGATLPGLSEWLLPLATLLLAVSWCYLWVYAAFAINGSLAVAKLAIIEVGTIAACYWLFAKFIDPAHSMYIAALVICCASGLWLPIAVLRELKVRGEGPSKRGPGAPMLQEDSHV